MNSICSVHIISRLDSQNKFHMFALFSGRHVGVPRRWWWLRSWLCRFISPGERQFWKKREQWITSQP